MQEALVRRQSETSLPASPAPSPTPSPPLAKNSAPFQKTGNAQIRRGDTKVTQLASYYGGLPALMAAASTCRSVEALVDQLASETGFAIECPPNGYCERTIRSDERHGSAELRPPQSIASQQVTRTPNSIVLLIRAEPGSEARIAHFIRTTAHRTGALANRARQTDLRSAGLIPLLRGGPFRALSRSAITTNGCYRLSCGCASSAT